MAIAKLVHGDPTKTDKKLEEEARAHLAKSASLQVVTELLTRLRTADFAWWSPKDLREAYPAKERMRWYAERADLRQKITTDLSGLAPKASRNKSPDFQADLIESVINDGDINVAEFENAFEVADLVCYGPVESYWKLFRKRMPWDEEITAHQDLIGWLLGALLSDKLPGEGGKGKAFLTPFAVRTAIDGRVWHTKIPVDARVAIDNARFYQLREKPNDPFDVGQDLQIATPALIAASIPLKDLQAVLDLAGAALGLEEPKPAAAGNPPWPTATPTKAAAPTPSAVAAMISDVAPSPNPPPVAPAAAPTVPGAGMTAAQAAPTARAASTPPPPMSTANPAKPAVVASPAKEAAPAKDAAPAKEAAAKETKEAAKEKPAPTPHPPDTHPPPPSDNRLGSNRDSLLLDELEHTNPWQTGSSIPEVAAAMEEQKKLDAKK